MYNVFYHCCTVKCTMYFIIVVLSKLVSCLYISSEYKMLRYSDFYQDIQFDVKIKSLDCSPNNPKFEQTFDRGLLKTLS